MFKVAICDDQEVLCTQLETVILEKCQTWNLPVEIEIFSSGEFLCNYLYAGKQFDLIFLDIHLQQLNGIQVGKILRNDLKNECTQIVYISCLQSYTMDIFETRPLNFLIKPLAESAISGVLKVAIKINSTQNSFFEFTYERKLFRVPFKDILYFECRNRIYEFYGKISKLYESLNQEQFMRIHKSFIINYQYLSETHSSSVTMIGGKQLPISRTYQKNFRKQIDVHIKTLRNTFI